MSLTNRCDVGVVGAGPAGAWAAYLLACRGARVRIFDPSHPREKPCGGGVTGRALRLVGEAIDLGDLPSVAIDRATFLDASGRSVDVPLPARGPEASLVVASRAEFDARLLGAAIAAGAEHVAARVLDVTRDGKQFAIETAKGTHRADRLVGADGAASLVRRRLVRPFTREQFSIATGFFARGVTSRAIVLEMTSDPPGYIWSFPRPDHLAIGICAGASSGARADALRATTARWIARTGIAPRAALAAYSWPIPTLSAPDFDALDVSGPGWLLVGDAAGLVDPITREGIFFALQSAQFAADAIVSAGDAAGRTARDYEDRLHADVLEELAGAARLKSGFFRPRFTRLLLDALEESEAVRSAMADLVSGIQGYRGLKWRLARTLELGLAWRALAG